MDNIRNIEINIFFKMHKYQLLIMLVVVCYAENNSTAVK